MIKNRLLILVSILVFSFLLSGCGDDSDDVDNFPEKPITLIVPWDAGGAGPDAMAKTLESVLSTEHGIDVVVENLPGGGSATGMTELINSNPDGYTIGLASSSILSLMATDQVQIEKDDFSNISFIGEDPYLLVVNPDSDWDDLDDFMSDIEENQGDIKVGTAGLNNVPHALAESTGIAVDSKVEHISFDGAPRAITEVMGGHIDAAIVKPSDGMSQLQAEEVIPLAIYSKERLELMDEVPTFEELGYDVFPKGEVSQISYLAAPADVNDEIIEKLNEIFNEALESKEYQDLANQLVFTVKEMDVDEINDEVNEVYESLENVAPEVFGD